MIYDFLSELEKLPEEPYDICIAGAGIAGIVLAIELAKKGKRVAILEGGGLELDYDSQEIYEGKVTGRQYFPLDICRLRYFGGTSNHWGGMCRPLDEIDFTKRPYVDWSGWPISKNDLEPYAAGASRILEIGEWENDSHDPKEINGNLKEIEFKFTRNLRFKDIYYDQLNKNKNIDLYLNANVTDIILDDSFRSVDSFTVETYGGATKNRI